MSVRHFKSLLFKSSRLQQEIEREQQRVAPDRMRLIKLKKIRLLIMDQLQRIAETHQAVLQEYGGRYQLVRVNRRKR
jgi:uncharacterized protein YdcH (DUF465 family)